MAGPANDGGGDVLCPGPLDESCSCAHMLGAHWLYSRSGLKRTSGLLAILDDALSRHFCFFLCLMATTDDVVPAT